MLSRCSSATASNKTDRFHGISLDVMASACGSGQTSFYCFLHILMTERVFIMKNFWWAIASAALIGWGAASAADMPMKAPPMPAFSWTGFYAGVNGGIAAMSDPSMSYVDGAINAISPINVTGSSSSSSMFGIHAGYNHEFANRWLVGIEGDWDWTKLDSSASPGIICSDLFGRRGQCLGASNLTDNAFLQTQVNWLASVRGRLGYVWNQWMLYGTAGVAFADVGYTGNIFCTGISPTLCLGGSGQTLRSSASETRVGAVLGAGADFKLTRNWVFGAEYLFYHFGGNATSTGGYTFNATGAPAPFFECTVAGQNCGAFSYGSFDIHTGRVRLSYQFQP
jgi:outer membrane immunogenic protein